MYLLKKVFELREKAHVDHEKPFLEHLEDLRILITKVVITLVISMIICFSFQGKLMDILRAPAEKVILVKQAETMPDIKKFEGIKVPTVDQWNEARKIEKIVLGLDPSQRGSFYDSLNNPELEFHARSVAILRAAKALPEEQKPIFVDSLPVEKEMKTQVLALIDSDPNVDSTAGSNIRMMSALKPTETFMLSMKLAFFAGIVLAFPLLLMFILQFVLPGLHTQERKVLWPAMAVGFGLFLGGVLFAYFFVLPRALLFFYEWSGGLGVSNDWRIGEYIGFATQFTLLFGLSFELPVVVMVLVKLGLLSYDTMARTRTYAIVAIYIAAAIITPTPDIMTLNLMALPMLFLYEICIWLAWFDRKKEREAMAQEEEEMRLRRLQWEKEDAEREEAAQHEEYHHDDYHDHDDYDHDYHDHEHHHDDDIAGDDEYLKELYKPKGLGDYHDHETHGEDRDEEAEDAQSDEGGDQPYNEHEAEYCDGGWKDELEAHREYLRKMEEEKLLEDSGEPSDEERSGENKNDPPKKSAENKKDPKADKPNSKDDV